MRILTIIIIAFVSLNSTAQLDELKRASDAADKVIGSRKKKKRDVLDFNKLKYVKPLIGTGGHGHTYPGASAPFGMMQLSPDTRFDGWDGCSGYHYSDSIIYGFSHTHLSGTGVSDYGDLLIVPQIGKPRIDPGYSNENGYQARFSHKDEVAEPGYYGVKLNEGEIDVRLTVSERAGMHEYRFNTKDGKRFILIDLDHRDKLISSSINIHDKTTISGHRSSHAWAEEQNFYFHLKLNTPYQKARVFKKNGRNKLLLIFPRNTEMVKVKVGMSHVSTDGAKLNLNTELPDWNFEMAKMRVQRKWQSELSKIGFYNGDPETMKTFYTALYHSYLNPNISNDVDGKYRYGDTIHQLEKGDFDNYTVFSLWDTYRATHPLFTLTQVERTNAFVNTFLRFNKFHGDLPVWELAGNETECMIGYHSVSVIADAYSKGIYDYDAYEALEAMIRTSSLDEHGKREYASAGFLGTGVEPESVSKTLEYAYDDFCIYRMIEQYSAETEDYAFIDVLDEYKKRSVYFANIYDPNSKFMRGRRSGQWHAPFDPAEVNFNYTEANSWQYSLYAPHAIGVLRDLMGGKDSLEMWLDRLFTTEMEVSGRHQADITGLIGQYAHGNEPSHHMAYLYNYTNAPEKTQFYIDKIQKEMYSSQPDGLSGNEDCGQMSSWYVMSALGLYQIAPSRPLYEFGRPILVKAKIQFENGKILVFKSNYSKKYKYLQSVKLNGVVLKRHYISHEELTSGGTLEYVMGPEPNYKSEEYDEAETMEVFPENFTPVPFFNEEKRIFDTDMSLSLNVLQPEGKEIYYLINPKKSDMESVFVKYTTPIDIDKTTTVLAYTVQNGQQSATIENTFVKKNTNISIKLSSKYSNQYAAAGDLSLIDGIRGGDEFRTGDWQGYWAQDIVSEVMFVKPRKLTEVGVGCLSDMKSWIFLPKEIEFEGSTDGVNYFSIGLVVLDAETAKDMKPHHQDVTIDCEDKEFKSIRVTVKNSGTCPEWHLRDGNDTWLFVDEIILR